MNNEGESKLEKTLAQLRQERDELRLHAHLLKAELKQEWNDVELKWQRFEPKLDRARSSALESAHDLGAAASLLGEEIANAYRRFRKSLE